MDKAMGSKNDLRGSILKKTEKWTKVDELSVLP